MKHLIIIINLFLIFFSCTTLSEEFTDSINKEDISKIEDIEYSVLEYRFTDDSFLLDKAKNEAEMLLANPVYNKEYKARIYAQMGQIEFFTGNPDKAYDYVEQIEITFPEVEHFYILKSLLESDIKNKIEILNNGIANVNTNVSLKLELAEIYYTEEDFIKAAALYDEAFLDIDSRLISFYEKKREMSYQFMENPPVNLEISEILGSDILTFKQICFLLLKDTNFLDNITVDKEISAEQLINKLVLNGYVYRSHSPLDICLRKDTAFLLLHVVSYLDNNKEILTKYSAMFKNGESPIPDVKRNDYFFDASLVLVEKEIMSLPDGINFFPEETISGLELSDIINYLKKLYM